MPNAIKNTLRLLLFLTLLLFCLHSPAQQPAFRVLAFYSTNVEKDHVDFARELIAFLSKAAPTNHFILDTTSDWSRTNDEVLKKYELVIWVNEFPHTEPQRRAFERYMENGGAWLGFHVSGYNDRDTHWPWLVDFLGGAVFYTNNWPPLAATLRVEDTRHPVTAGMPPSYRAPINEWYQWKPSPRLDKRVKVLISLDTSNYPLGKKDIIRSGDLPVVWTNTRYHMVYMNMGHGDHVLDLPIQNEMFIRAIDWLGKMKKAN